MTVTKPEHHPLLPLTILEAVAIIQAGLMGRAEMYSKGYGPPVKILELGEDDPPVRA